MDDSLIGNTELWDSDARKVVLAEVEAGGREEEDDGDESEEEEPPVAVHVADEWRMAARRKNSSDAKRSLGETLR